MIEWTHLVALGIAVLGSSVIHFSQGLMKLGILRRQGGDSSDRTRWIYRTGVVLNFSAPLWVIVANRFGPTALYTSMYAIGLLPLLLFSRLKLNHRVTKGEGVGAMIIVGASVILAFAVSREMTVSLSGLSALPFVWLGFGLLGGLLLWFWIRGSESRHFEGLLFGLVGGCFLAMDSLVKGIAQSDGGLVRFLPQTNYGMWLFAFSFVGAGVAFGMTQWAHLRGAAPSQTIAGYDAGYISLPILLLPVLHPGVSLNLWSISGLLLMMIGLAVLGLSSSRRDRSHVET